MQILEEEGMRSLCIEYAQWRLSCELRDYFLCNIPIGKKSWLSSTFDRWLLSVHNCVCQSHLYVKNAFFPLYPDGLHVDDDVHRVLSKELSQELRSRSHKEAQRHIETFLNFLHKRKSQISVALDVSSPPTIALDMMEDGNPVAGLQVGLLSTEKTARIFLLIREYGLLATVIMLLRYESLGCGGYQWAEIKPLHQLYYEEFGVRYEGFASPLNSRLLGKPDAHFCSLFLDTDAVFGSLGDFMQVKLISRGGGWYLNPPFIEYLLEQVADKVCTSLDLVSRDEHGSLYFFVLCPAWEGTRAWQKLRTSSHLRRHFHHSQGAYLLEDTYENTLSPFCDLSLFVLGFLPEGVESKLILVEDVVRESLERWKTSTDPS